jgi:hypothetical protein
MRQEPGKWMPLNSRAIIASVRRVFEEEDMGVLTDQAYKHITLHMGFIAHFDLHGFKAYYGAHLQEFARGLIRGEFYYSPEMNEASARRFANDPQLVRDYGPAYCQSACDASLGIIKLAKEYLQTKQLEQEALASPIT